MITPWERKLLMDVFILTEHQYNYDIIKHANKDCVHNIYFDPKKYPVCNKFKGDIHSLRSKDLATSTINYGYKIEKNGFYNVGGLTANRFSHSRCIKCKGDIKCRQLTLFRSKTFHNDAIKSPGVTEKN